MLISNKKFKKNRNTKIPIEARAVIELISANKPRTAFDLYKKTAHLHDEPPLKFNDFQIEDIKTVLFGIKKIKNGKIKFELPQEYMLLRCRNGSKTRDAVFLTCFMGYMKGAHDKLNRILWYSAAEDHLDIVKDYFSENRYVKRVTSSNIYLWNGNKIKLKIMSEKKSKSSRSEITIYDEEQDMNQHFYALSVATGWERGSGRKIHLGTTAVNTVLHKNYLRLQPKGLVSTHTIDDCTWLDKERALEEYEFEPQWYTDSQLFCKWVRPGGRVFENIEELETPITNWLDLAERVCFGSDPNPKSGHGLVGVAFLKYKGENCIYIFESHELINDIENYVFAVDNVIQRWCNDKRFKGIEIESQFGEELYKMITAHKQQNNKFVFTMTWNEQNKAKRIEYIRMHKICYCKNIDKDLIQQISGAAWDEKSPRPKLAKSPDQHKLDSFIHACHQQSMNIIKRRDVRDIIRW